MDPATDAGITPTAGSFDKNPAGAGHQDIQVMTNFGTYQPVMVTCDGVILTPGVEYVPTPADCTLQTAWMAGLAEGTYTITFVMSGGTSPSFALTVRDTTPDITITGLPGSHTMQVGGQVSWTPKPSGGTWRYDSAYLSMTSAAKAGDTYTFTALKQGTTTATYTANGASWPVTITIQPKAEVPPTGDDGPIVKLLGLLLAGLGAFWLLSRRKMRIE